MANNNNPITLFGLTTFRNQYRKFGIKADDRRRHMYLIGKTGMGKSTILENMIVADIRDGNGVAVVDPHGDLAEKIIEFVPTNRINDVIYFNPADIDYPIAFNIVEQVDEHLRHLVASGLIGVFQKLWADSWGPRLEYILRNAILAILDYPGSTLLGVVRILSDKIFRKKVVSNVQDPVVKAFWEKEFASYADKFASEAVSPIQNKVGQFLSSSFMRNIVGQVKSSIDMRKVMDEGKILIMNLSKGRIGEDNSALLGAMMITKIQLAAMSRVDITEEERKDFYLYIDEFQNFTTDSFANILSEARKYRLCLIMAHQYIEQLNEKVKPAVFGNVGTLVVFRVGAADAEELVKEFTPVFLEEDIVNLPKYEMYLKLMIDGVASAPFSAKGMPPLRSDEKTGNVEKVIRSSRERYATPKEIVEEKIRRWHENLEEEEQKAKGDHGQKKAPFPSKYEGGSPNVQGGTSAIQNNHQNTIPRNFVSAGNNFPNNYKAPLIRSNPAASEATNKPVFNRNAIGNTNTPSVAPSVNFPSASSIPTSVSSVISPTSSNNLSNSNNSSNSSNNPSISVKPAFIVKPVPAPEVQVEPKGFESICGSCGKKTYTSFKPDGVRPVYCKECLLKNRAEKQKELEQRQEKKKKEQEKTKEMEVVKQLEEEKRQAYVDKMFNNLADSSSEIIKLAEEDTNTEETVVPEKEVPSLSLQTLNNIRPVDFRGREIKVVPVINNNEEEEIEEKDKTVEDDRKKDNKAKEQTPVILTKNDAQELSEGETIIIQN
ncbi:MAG: type IV secretion system DNA-binding domain-containing protein [Planctomycetes bacterium]|jgi:CxxC-x17-CxxC domain-containing protein|nr:type IV secretion system DNA-binding domain-containing protein [Planctomycetota bacterium]